MSRAIRCGQFEYVLLEDRELPADDPARAVWVLRTLTAEEEAWIQDQAASIASDTMKVDVHSGTVGYLSLRLGLVGVRSYAGPDGPVHIAHAMSKGRRMVSDDTINQIAPAHRLELSKVIGDAGKVDAETAGKSSAPST